MQANTNTAASVSATNRRRFTVGALLTALALGVGVLAGMRLASEPTGNRAYAQDTSGLVNPADQRRQMIAELRRLNDRLDGIQQTLNSSLRSGPVDVSVVQLPKNALASE
jgi:hypothetical protein